jgi:hypothetical protein
MIEAKGVKNIMDELNQFFLKNNFIPYINPDLYNVKTVKYAGLKREEMDLNDTPFIIKDYFIHMKYIKFAKPEKLNIDRIKTHNEVYKFWMEVFTKYVVGYFRKEEAFIIRPMKGDHKELIEQAFELNIKEIINDEFKRKFYTLEKEESSNFFKNKIIKVIEVLIKSTELEQKIKTEFIDLVLEKNFRTMTKSNKNKIENCLMEKGLVCNVKNWDTLMINHRGINEGISQELKLNRVEAKREIIKFFDEKSRGISISNSQKWLKNKVMEEENNYLENLFRGFQSQILFDDENNINIETRVSWRNYRSLKEHTTKEEIINLLGSEIKELKLLSIYLCGEELRKEVFRQIQKWVHSKITKIENFEKMCDEISEIYIDELLSRQDGFKR